MFKKISVSVLALVVAGYAGSAMAQSIPFQGDNIAVPVTVYVQAMAELYTDTAPVALNIVNAGSNTGSAGATTRSLGHMHNTAVNIMASLSADIPNNTQFSILVNPPGPWTQFADANGSEKIVTWRREGGSYAAPTGFAGATAGAAPGTAVTVLAAAKNNLTGVELETIQYFADSSNVMADVGDASFNVIWTIAAQP